MGVEKVEEMACHLSNASEGSIFKYFINENSDNGVCYESTVFDF